MEQAYEELLTDFLSNGASDTVLTEVNGIPLPEDYLAFMHTCNGGEGDMGKNAYIQIFSIEELAEANQEYEIQKYCNGCHIGNAGMQSVCLQCSGLFRQQRRQ